MLLWIVDIELQLNVAGAVHGDACQIGTSSKDVALRSRSPSLSEWGMGLNTSAGALNIVFRWRYEMSVQSGNATNRTSAKRCNEHYQFCEMH